MNVLTLPVQRKSPTQRPVVIPETTPRPSACGHENPPEAAFCGECGIAVSSQHLSCATCGQPNPTQLKFCRSCGAGQFTTSVQTLSVLTSPVASLSPSPPSSPQVDKSPAFLTQHSALGTRHSGIVGREAELTQLQSLLAKALRGERQVVFVTGEAGIGKTTLIDAFLARIRDRTDTDVRMASGQCVEQYGPGEAYLPLLEATAQLCRAPGGERRIAALQQYAPSWLAQLPSLLEPEAWEQLQQRVQGTSRERMLREMAEMAELFTAQRGLVVLLEDLHWSDVSTLDWITYMARRRGPAKLLILGTYRPADVLANHHPLHGVVQELQARGQCEVVQPAPLTEEAIAQYLAGRLTANGEARPVVSHHFIPLLHHRTGGNPLFLVNTVDDLLWQGVFAEKAGQQSLSPDAVKVISAGIPATVRQLIERQLERLPEPEQRLLEAASVAGVEFAAAEAAAGLLIAQDTIEATCEQLARTGQWLREAGAVEWPDGTISGRYSFLHVVHHDVVYAQVAEVRRIHLHRRMAARKEAAYRERVGEIAAELATHFAAGRDLQPAVTYSRQAAQTAVRRHAHKEAITHLTTGLELLRTLPDTAERVQQELSLQLMLGEQLTSVQGFGVEEVERAFARALELCRRLGETPQMFRVLLGLWAFYVERAELTTARELAEQLLRLAQQVKSRTMLTWAHLTRGITLHFAGEQLAARQHLEQCLAFYDPHDFRIAGASYDPAVLGLTTLGPVLWLLGYPDQAVAQSVKGLALARELTQPYSVSYAASLGIRTRVLRGESQEAHTQVEELIALCREHEFASYLALSLIVQGWLFTEHGRQGEGIEQMHREMLAWRATGAEAARPYYLALLAETHGQAGEPEAGRAVLAECWQWMDKTGGRVFEAELYRLRGELTLQQENQKAKIKGQKAKITDPRSLTPHPQGEAEACFHKAIAIARQQQTKSLELRATMSLARLWRQQGKSAEAREQLEEIYHWFTEGVDTKDLQDAAVLLGELGGRVRMEVKSQKSKVENQKLKMDTEDCEHERADEWESGRQENDKLIAPAPFRPFVPSFSQPHYPIPDPRSPAPSTQHPVPAPQSSAVFRPEGNYWTVSFAGATCRLKEARGLHYIAHLLHQPHQEVHVITLDTMGAGPSEEPAEAPSLQDSSLRGVHPEGFSDAGEILDPRERAASKQRLNELREELAEAREFHDLGRSERLMAELDFLTHELTRAVGLGGQARQVGSPAERARVNITRAIKVALRKISEHHPALGQHLATTIKTGTYCAYTPDVRMPITWQG